MRLCIETCDDLPKVPPEVRADIAAGRVSIAEHACLVDEVEAPHRLEVGLPPNPAPPPGGL